jgi:dienelactone hydrolase
VRCAFAALVAFLFAPGAFAGTQHVTIRTDDGVSLAGTWYEPGARQAPAVILVHMLHRTRQDWESLAAQLASEGIGALAIDLRGHGESSGAIDSGDAADYSALVRDVVAARRYLASRGDVQQTHVGIIGASIGANLAVLEAAADPSVVSLALLSASVDYRGLKIEAPMKKYGARPVLFVASDDDPYALRSSKDLQKTGPGTRQLLVLSHAGHGTAMLSHDADLAHAIVDWFHRTL